MSSTAARQYVPGPVIETMPEAQIGIIAFGSTEPAVQEARFQLSQEGVASDYLRLRAIPFTSEVDDFVHSHDRIYVVEQNRDGQLHQIMTIEYPDRAMNLVSLAYTDGLPFTARRVQEGILSHEEE